MASAAFTSLVTLTALAAGDVFAAVDISDSTQSPQGSLKQITMTNVIAGLGLATLPNITSGTINGQTVSSAASLTGTLAVASTLGVTGAVTLSSTLHTVGAATFDSTIASGAIVTTDGRNTLTVVSSANSDAYLALSDDVGTTKNWRVGKDVTASNTLEWQASTVAGGGTYATKASLTDAGVLSATFSGPLTGNVTGNVSGSSGSTTGNAATATKLATARTIAITGDLAYTSASFDGSGNVTGAGTLATVNANVGSFGSTTAVPVVTVNAKGLVTAVTTATIAAAASSLSGTTLASGVVTSSLTTVGALASGSIASGFGSINIGTNALTAGVLTLSNSDTIAKQTPTTFTLADSASQTIATAFTTNRGLLIVSGPNAVVALFNIQGTTTTLVVANAAYSTTNGGAGTTNVFSTGGNTVLQNKTGGSVTYAVTFIGIP